MFVQKLSLKLLFELSDVPTIRGCCVFCFVGHDTKWAIITSRCCLAVALPSL